MGISGLFYMFSVQLSFIIGLRTVFYIFMIGGYAFMYKKVKMIESDNILLFAI